MGQEIKSEDLENPAADETTGLLSEHSHSHGDAEEKDAKKEKGGGHGHSHEGSGHGHSYEDAEEKDAKEEKGGGHGHSHGGDELEERDMDEDRNKLIRATVLCFLFMIGEIIGGYLAHSLAIMTDAAHLLSDVAGMAISIAAISWARKAANQQYSFGYHRIEILGALASILLIWVLTAVLVYEAVQRMTEPEYVKGETMFICASLGLVINILMLLVLGGHGHSHGGDEEGHGHGQSENINVNAAYVHVLGDLIQTVGVIIAACFIWTEPWDVGRYSPLVNGVRTGPGCDDGPAEGCSYWSMADPISTCFFAILVLGTTIGIAKQSIHLLMNGSPTNIKVSEVLYELKIIEGVSDVHDFHCWSITEGKNYCSFHLIVEDNVQLDQNDTILKSAIKVCHAANIGHPTVQIEHASMDCHISLDHSQGKFKEKRGGDHGHAH